MRFLLFTAVASLIATPVLAGSDSLLGKFSELYNNHDADGLQSLWEEDGKLIFAGGEITGSRVIGDRYRLIFGSLVEGETLSMRIDVEERFEDGDTVTAWGTFAQIHLGAVVDHGKFVARATRNGGEWKLSRVWILGDPRQ
jgi:hypothetical protein